MIENTREIFVVPETIVCGGATLYPDGKIELDPKPMPTHYRDMGTKINDMSNILLASRVFQSMHLMLGLHNNLIAAGFSVLPSPYSTLERERKNRYELSYLWSAARTIMPEGMYLQFRLMMETLWGLPKFEKEKGEWLFGAPVVGVSPGIFQTHTGHTRDNSLNSVFISVNVHPLGIQGSPLEKTSQRKFSPSTHGGRTFYYKRFPENGRTLSSQDVEKIRKNCENFEIDLALTEYALEDHLDTTKAHSLFTKSRLRINARKRLKPYRLNNASRKTVSKAIERVGNFYYKKGLVLNFWEEDALGYRKHSFNHKEDPTWYGVVVTTGGTQKEVVERAKLLLAELPVTKREWRVLLKEGEKLSSSSTDTVYEWTCTIGYKDLPWEQYWILLGTDQNQTTEPPPYNTLLVL